MNLVRDLLDARLVNANGRMLGRVDGVLLDVRPDRPPRVAAIEVGAVTLARRIHPTLGRRLRAFAIRWMPVPWRPVQLPLTMCRDIGVDVTIDVDAETERRLLRLENWLSRHIVRRLPGGAKS
jgi:hypothetical protein